MWGIMWHVLDVISTLTAVGNTDPSEAIHTCFGISGGSDEPQALTLLEMICKEKHTTPYAEVDGLVDTDDVSSLS